MSSYGVIRGLHYQRMPYTQSKLVRCVKGAVLDVAVDIRRTSTFGQHVAVELTEEKSSPQLFIPRGFAHSFAVFTEIAVFQYKCDNFIILNLMVVSILQMKVLVSTGIFYGKSHFE